MVLNTNTTETIQKKRARTKNIGIEDIRKAHFNNKGQLLV